MSDRHTAPPLYRNWRSYVSVGVPPFGALRRRHRRGQAVQLAVLVAFIVGALTCWAAWLLPSGLFFEHFRPALFILFLFTLLQIHRRTSSLPASESATLLEDAAEEHLGRYSRAELEQLVGQVEAAFGGREQPRFYIVDDRGGFFGTGAAVNALFANWARRWNAIYLSRDLLRLLRPMELRAVVAHEMAHFHGALPLILRANLTVAFCRATFVIAVVALLDWHLGMNALIAWPAALALNGAMVWLVGRLVGRGRELEHLADVEAARRYGREAMINALLRLTSRQEVLAEVIHQVLLAAAKQPAIDVVMATEECLEALPPRELSAAEARPIIEGVIAEGRQQWLRELSRKEVAAQKESFEVLLEDYRQRGQWTKVDWRDYDTIRPDGRLDEDELEHFGSALLDAPHTPVCLLPSEQPTAPEALLEDTRHPTTRDRILYLLREVPAGPLVESRGVTPRRTSLGWPG